MKAAKDIDSYLAAVAEPAKTTLEKMRRVIKQAAPKAEERISYGIPSFYMDKYLVGFAAFKNHCSFFPGSAPVKVFKDELKDYKTSAGTIQFPVDKPLPVTLVKKIVKMRMKDIEEKAALKSIKKKLKSKK